ncbi:MAG TPA: polyketide synthase, partial [Candidatus Portnoybacteria bacterium]|nr:polyketide synthase [Candidatus Portnoybacteria bacterium]
MKSKGSDRGKNKTENSLDLQIAVIGFSLRFPGAASGQEFWQNLKSSRETLTVFSPEELILAGEKEEEIKKTNYVRSRGLIGGVEYFAADFFGKNINEAIATDPQIRLFYESCWEALENAGCDPKAYHGLIGVYAGAKNNTNWENKIISYNQAGGNRLNKLEINQAINKDFLSTKIAYDLNLSGPAVSINTACSTSLVTIYYACQGLLAGETDIALAGGVSIAYPQKRGYVFEDGAVLSSDGHCRAFDSESSGTIFSDGLGVVVLKRLADAVADGDNILAVIKGSAINNDGHNKIGYTAPSIEGQKRVIEDALNLAQVIPETITYVEAHGTATKLGD